jgi:carbon storage regulator
MLVLSRLRGQSVIIGGDITITVTDIRGDKVRLGIAARPEVTIHRQEIHEQIKQANVESANLSPHDINGHPLVEPKMMRAFIEQNKSTRARLGQLVARLKGADFDRAVGKDWTISTILSHLAFWDQRTYFLLTEAQAGRFEPVRLSKQAIDSINHAVRVLSEAVPGATAGKMANGSAELVDGEVEKIDDSLVEKIISGGFERWLNRSLHRMEHIRKIEEALGA